MLQATPCGSKQAVPFRSELLRAQPVLIRRLCRLAKLGLGTAVTVMGGEGHEVLIDAAVPFRSELLRGRPVVIRRLCRLAKLLVSR